MLEDFDSQKNPKTIGLIGMGGIGKTALGLVVAHRITKDYPDAQIFLDLKGTTTPLSAVDAMRHVILSFEPTMDLRALDEANMSAAYQSVLHEKKVLLFLDNAKSADQIAPLRPPETCAMLITSRWSFTVPGLRSRRVNVMNEGNAKAFLLELCPRIGEGTAALAKACVYLPLALRIAGSFLQINDSWGVEKYLARLNDRKHRLATFEQSREEAELTTEPDVLATFELSYSQLSEENRRCWRMLGVFPASFDLGAVQVMWDLEEDTATKLLGSLRRYSLLDYDETSSRYGLHDLLADYALLQMEAEEEREARLKHASHYKDVLSAADDLYQGGDAKLLMGLRLFDLEWENIRVGQAWVSQNTDSRDYLELCNEYPNAGHMILSLRLHPRQYISWLEKGLDAARRLGNKQYEGYHLGNLGLAYYALGETRKAMEFYEQALIIAREIGDRHAEGATLGNLGFTFTALGEARKAMEFYDQALIIAREIGDRRGEGNDLDNLGNAYLALGEARKAIQFHEQALVIDREIGDRHGEGNDLGNLGNDYLALGEARKAIEFYEQWLAIAGEIGDHYSEGIALSNLGIAYYDLGETGKAVQFNEQALVIAREIGDRRTEGRILGSLGGAYYDLGEARRAIEFFEQALVIDREVGDRQGEGIVLDNLGNAYLALGDVSKATEFYEQALVIYREMGDRRGEGVALGKLGIAFYRLNEYAIAEKFYSQQITITQEIGDEKGEGNAFWGLAICKIQGEDISSAREMLQKALEIFKEIESPRVNTVQEMLDTLDVQE